MFWSILFVPSTFYLLAYFIALPINERVSGIKHLQMMTKLSPIMYWYTCFLWDYICYTFVLIVILIVMRIFDKYQIFTGLEELGKCLV